MNGEAVVLYDETWQAWLWQLVDCHDDEAVGPFRTETEAAKHARQNGFRVLQTV